MCWKKSSYKGSQLDYDPMMSQPIEHDFDEIESIDGQQSMSDMLFVMTFRQINELMNARVLNLNLSEYIISRKSTGCWDKDLISLSVWA